MTIAAEQMEELQAELNDLNVRDIAASIADGASCETAEDFVQNIDDAIEAAKLLLSELKSIRKQIA